MRQWDFDNRRMPAGAVAVFLALAFIGYLVAADWFCGWLGALFGLLPL